MINIDGRRHNNHSFEVFMMKGFHNYTESFVLRIKENASLILIFQLMKYKDNSFWLFLFAKRVLVSIFRYVE